MERGTTMAFHSAMIGVLFYIILIAVGVDQKKSEDRSVLIAGLALVYMVLYGHDVPPVAMNSNIY
jgi:hypothetical protein